MATIEQHLTLTDGVTKVLQRMLTGLDRTAAGFRSVGAAASGMEARTAAASAGAAASVTGVGAAAGTAAAGVTGLGATATSVFASIKAGATALIAPMAGLFAIQSLVGYIQQATAAVGSLGASELKLNTIMRQRMGVNAEAVNSIKDLIGAQEKLGIVNREVQTAGAQQLATFATQKSTLESLLPAMNNLLVQQNGYASTAENATQIANMMGRALTGQTGALTRVGISFNAAQEEIIKFGTEEEKAATLAQIITDNVGKMNEVFGATAAGKAAQAQMQLDAALRDVGKAIKGNITAMKPTAIQAQTEVVRALGGVLIEVTGVLRGFTRMASDAYAAIRPKLQAIGTAVTSVYPYIKPIILGIAGAFVAYKTALAVAWAWQLKVKIASALMAAATAVQTAVQVAQNVAMGTATAVQGAFSAQLVITQLAMVATTFATQGLTAGMAALNMVFAANPIGFTVLAIFALIGALYGAVAAVNYFMDTSISATGIVFGVFAALFAHIWNFVAFTANNFMAFAEFLANVFVDPLAAIHNLFATIWNGVVQLVGQAVNSIISMISAIPGMDKVVGKISPVDLGGLSMGTVDIAGGWTAPKMSYKNQASAFSSGYDMGAGLADKIGSYFSTPKMADAVEQGVGGGLQDSGVDDAAKGTDGNTKAMKEAMEITQEDLKYLRDIAQQEAINKYTTASVKIDMGGVSNNISNGVDVDGMMMRLTDTLRNGMANGGEKVRAM